MRTFLSVLFLCCFELSAQSTYALFNSPALALQPPTRSNAQIATDEARDRVLLVGGRGGGVLHDYWEWDGAAWLQIVPSNPLNLNHPFRLVYSPQRAQILAVTGSYTNGGPPMQIWAWSGSDWLLVDNSGPVSRADAFEIAWDSSRGVLVMFGSPVGAETWEWDGVNWQLRGTGGPLPREKHSMVYDEARQRVVLFGGIGFIGGHLNDTWEWDGAGWVERFGIPAPQTSHGAARAYDRARQRVVLHGGSFDGNRSGAVYEYDGIQWQQRVTVGGPHTIVNASMTYVPSAGCMLLFGGELFQANLYPTRTLCFVQGTLASSQSHQAGCAGPAGVPQLQPIQASRPILGSSFDLQFQNLPASPLNLVFAAFGGSDQTWGAQALPLDLSPLGFTGCALHVEPTVIEPLSNLGGSANWNIAVPMDPSLDGLDFFLQGFVLTPGFNPGGGVLSDSLRCTLGVL